MFCAPMLGLSSLGFVTSSVNLGLNLENKAAGLILVVGGYAAYTLLVTITTNAAHYVFYLPLIGATVFAAAFADAAEVLLFNISCIC
jgi:hypothetical protein